MIAPLRTVIDTYRNECGSAVERLECGHETLSNGIYKARCMKCSMNEAGLAS